MIQSPFSLISINKLWGEKFVKFYICIVSTIQIHSNSVFLFQLIRISIKRCIIKNAQTRIAYTIHAHATE